MIKKYKLIIFDLDGTLLDTSQGIFNSVRYAEKKMGFEPIPDSMLRKFVGPPPKMMYMELHHVSEDIALEAAKKHREYSGKKAIYEASLYPGIKEELLKLKDKGYKLAVATLKAQTVADKVLSIYGISDMFDAVVGMNEVESLKKSDTIRISIEMTGVEDTGKAVVIGDTEYDSIGAEQAGVDFIPVTYGFGFVPGESGYETVIDQPSDLTYIF